MHPLLSQYSRGGAYFNFARREGRFFDGSAYLRGDALYGQCRSILTYNLAF